MGEDQLTQREVQCVVLAGQGLTDKEIAQRLRPGGRMSPKTVSNHLSAAFRKLGVNNRAAAAERVARNYPVPPMPIAQAARGAFDEVVAIGSNDTENSDAGPLYRAYLSMGRWRTLPRLGGARLPIIVVWALTGIMAITGVLGLITVFDVADQVAKNLYAAP